ncbi:MAG: hypothetical protein ACUVRA_07920 [Candidatus Bathyarchaeaceae archaeon]
MSLRLRQNRRGASNIIVVVLSLVIIVVIVSNIVLWSYEMNQLDWEKMKENISITNVEPVSRSSWFVAQSEYTVNTGSHVSGTYTDTQTINDWYERFIEASATISYNPSRYTLGGSTTWISGSVSDLASNDGSCMTFRSYASAFEYVQVTYVSAGTGSGTTGNPTPAYPTGLQANDLILLQVTVRDTTTTPTTPAGFTLLYGPDSTGTGRQWIYYKFSDGTESGTITITIGGTVCKVARMYAFRNVAPSNFTEEGEFGTGIGDTISAQSVTTTDAKRLAVSFVFVNDNNAVGSFTGETGGDWTEAAEFRTTAGSDGCIQLQTAIMASAGTISGGSYTMGAADPWGVRAFALIPSQIPSEYTCEVEFTGISNTDVWSQLVWTVDSAWDTSSVTVTMQLYDWTSLSYPTSEDGYITYTSSSTPNTDETKTQTIITNPTHFRDDSGNWKIKVKGVKTTTTQFNFKADRIEFKTTTPNYYSLDVTGIFAIDISTYPLAYIQTIEIQLRYRADDAGETWYLKAYNWTSLTYSDSGFNSTTGHIPTTEWDYYAVNLTDKWRSYVRDDGTIHVNIADEGADSNQTTVDIDFLGIRAVIDGTRFTFKNEGALTSHLVSLWIINSTNHRRYDINIFVNSADTTTYIRADVSLPVGQFTVKVVTRRGNIAVYSES